VTTSRRDWLKWVAAACALAATASAEYSIAIAVGYSEWVAAAVPGALDAYVLRALQTHREVFTAVLAMVAVNAASHLVTAGMLPVNWVLVTAVAAVPALVLWRVHALRTPKEARTDTLWGVTAAEGHAIRSTEHAVTAVPPVPDTPPVTEHASTVTEHAGPLHCVHGPHPAHRLGTPCPVTEHTRTVDEHADDALALFVPEDWVAFTEPGNEHGVDDACACTQTTSSTLAECARCEHAPHRAGACLSRLPLAEHADPFTLRRVLARIEPERDAPGTVTALPLPAGFTASTEHADALRPGDEPFVTALREHMAEHGLTAVPAQRDVKEILGVGTPRARRVHRHVTDEHASTDGGTP
jgi:hypothetical protein